MTTESEAARAVPGERVVWGEMAPCEHVLQIYRDDEQLLDALQGYVTEGLAGDESVIVIATAPHRDGLNRRLAAQGVDVDAESAGNRFFSLSAQETLDRFMVQGAPDEALFESVIGAMIEQARAGGRSVRAFGQMVALLWARGNHSAALHLEYLWNQLMRKERFPLFCAYPRAGFTDELSASVSAVCRAHTRILLG